MKYSCLHAALNVNMNLLLIIKVVDRLYETYVSLYVGPVHMYLDLIVSEMQ